MSEPSAHYVDFQRFFQARQNLDLVSAEGWRHATERAWQANAVADRAVKRSRKARKTS